MKFGLLSLLFFTFLNRLVWALDPAIIRSIKDINRQELVKSPLTCSEQLFIPYTSSLKNNNPDYNDCMVALCGPPSSNPSAWVTDTNFSNNIPTGLKNDVDQLDPVIKKIYEISSKRSLDELEKLDRALTNPNLEGIDPDKFSSTFRDDINSIIFKSKVEIEVDKNKASDKRLELKLIYPEKASSDFKKALAEYANSYKKFLLEDYSSEIARTIYTPEELHKIAINKLTQANNALEKSKTTLTKDQQIFIKAELQKAQDQLTQEKPADFKSENFFFNLDGVFLNLNRNDLLAEKPKCNSKNCQKTYVEFFKNQNIRQNIIKLKTDASDPQIGNQYINRCKANIIASAMASTDKEKSKALFDRAKKDIIANVLPRFSEHSRKILLKYLNNDLVFSPKKIIPGKDKKSIINDFKSNAKYYLNESNNDYNLRNSNLISFETNMESAIRKSIIINSNIGEIDSISDQGSPCNLDMVASAWDSFLPVKMTKQLFGADNDLVKNLPDKDHVFISDFSCTHEHKGKHNVAHEIGHALNHVFAHTPLSGESLAKYKDLRNCVTDNYINPQMNQTIMSQPGDSVYSEEDTADIFAFITYPQDNNLFACSLVKPSYDNKAYSELAFVLNEGDTHSTAFTRVIMEAINKNIDLPVSCQRAIVKDSPKLRFKKCL